jgi:hypothetical protein
MPVTKVISNERTIVEYTLAEFTTLLGVEQVLAVYPLDGKIEVVTKSGASGA